MDRLRDAQKIGYFWAFVMGFALGIVLGFTGSSWVMERGSVAVQPAQP